MPVDYQHVRPLLAAGWVPDPDPNTGTGPLPGQIFCLKSRPPNGNTLTTAHGLYVEFDDPTATITFVAWERDQKTLKWVALNAAAPQVATHRQKLIGNGSQDCDLFIQVTAATWGEGGEGGSIHVTEQGTNDGLGYGGSDDTVLVTETPSTVATVTDVPASAVPVLLLAANANRLSFTIFNGSNRPLTIKCGAGVTATSRTTKLPPEMEWHPDVRYTGIVEGFWAAGATGSAAVTEYTP